MTKKERLELDERVYGVAYFKIENGKMERIDPTTIRIMKPSEQSLIPAIVRGGVLEDGTIQGEETLFETTTVTGTPNTPTELLPAEGKGTVAERGIEKCTCPDDQCLLGAHESCRWLGFVRKSSEGQP